MSRLELEGELHRIRRDRLNLALQVPTKTKAIKDILDKVAIRQVQEIDFEGAFILAEELRNIKREIIGYLEKEAQVEKEME